MFCIFFGFIKCYDDLDDFDPDENPEYSYYVSKKKGAIIGVPKSVGKPCINPRFTGAFVIDPSVTLDGQTYPINGIGKYAFYQTRIQSISFPESVTKIYEYAFSGCHYLEIVDLSKTKIDAIKDSAFSNTSIRNILLPQSLTEIGNFAFATSPITEIKLPSTVTKLGNYLCCNCTKLKTADLSAAGATDLPKCCFRGCVSLSTVKLPSKLVNIHNEAFSYTAISSITIPQNCLTFGRLAFSYCSLLTEIKLPNKMSNIDYGCFKGCVSLKKIDMSSINITMFSNDLFRDCTSLTTIVYPKGFNSFGEFSLSATHMKELTLSSEITNIQRGAFSWNVFLQKVDLSALNLDSLPDEIFRMCTHLESVTLPSKIKRIPERAFAQCVSLKSIDMTKTSINTIGNNAFYMCSTLAEVSFPESLSSIEDGAFASCAFVEFTAPASLNFIGAQAFFSCRKLKTADLANSAITDLSDFAFAVCTSLTKITIPTTLRTIGASALADTAISTIAKSSFGEKIASIGSRAFENCKELRNIDISGTSVTVLNGTFRGCNNLAICKLPANIQRIEDSPFFGTAVTPLPIPETLTSLGPGAFANTSFNGEGLPTTLTSIGDYAFAWCPSLTSLDFSKSTITSIGNYAFFNSSLKTIQWPTTLQFIGRNLFLLTPFKDVKLPASINDLEVAAFEANTIKTLDMSDTAVFDLPNRTFAHTKELIEVKLPNTIRSIGDHCFFGSSIQKIELPKTVSELGPAAFGMTQSLTSIDFSSTAVKNISAACFFNSSIARVVLPQNCTIFEWAFALSDLTGLSGSIFWMGRYAFFYCHKLARISLTQDCYFTDVADHCFSHCFKLSEVKLPSNLTVVHNLAFCNCTSLKQVNLAETQVRQLLYGAFANCTKLTGYSIPATCTQIGDECFLNTSIFSVELNKEISTIGTGAFRSCHHLKNIDMSKTSVTKILNKCFSGCFALNDIQLPEKLETIGNYAFQHCGITYITMPETLKGLGRMAFSGCYNLQSADLSKTAMISIACGAFSNCSKLSKVILPPKLSRQNSKVPLWLYETTTVYVNFFNETHRPNYNQDEVVAEYSEPHEFVLAQSGPLSNAHSLTEFDLSNTKMVDLFPWFLYNATSLTDVRLPNTLATIGEGVFGNTAITKIVIPNSVTNIGPSAFRNCAKLTTIDLEKLNFTVIGSSMFLGTRKLQSAKLPPKTETIGNFAFFNSSIGSINLPPTVETLGRSVFAYSNLETINLQKTKVTKIPDHGFLGTEKLKNVTFNPDTTHIGRAAFMNSGIESIDIPSKVQSIESLAFAGCKKLKTATLTHCTLNRIPYGVFAFCTSLETVNLPSGLMYVHDDAFEGCTALRTVYYFGCNVIASKALGKLKTVDELEVLVLENFPHREFLGARVSSFYNSDLEEQLEQAQCAKRGLIRDYRPQTIPDPKYPRVEMGRLMRITYKEHD